MSEITLNGVQGNLRIKRMNHGFPRIIAEAEIDMFYGLGYAHGRDRQLHMWLLKLIGRGKASQHLMAGDDIIEADKYFRWINLAGDADDEVEMLPPEVKQTIDAYCQGVNDAVQAAGTPFEFRLCGYKPDRWAPADVILMAKMIGFVGLAQSQGDIEKFIIEMIQNGVSTERIKTLFPYIEEDIPDELIAILKKIKLERPNIPESVPWKSLMPNFSNSNNWAVTSEKSASGKPILCGDPHLALQLPSIWYTAHLSCKDYYLAGATVPGIPMVALGRSPHLAWSATYGTADMSDYFIEEIKQGQYRRGNKWLPFSVREEIIRPKKGKPITLRIHENDHGILEGEPDEDGYYLCFAWSGKQKKNTGSTSLCNFMKILKARNVEEAMDYFAGLEFAPFSWVMADCDGNIGYQLSGLYPKKAPKTSGLLPYAGWDPDQEWDGMHDPHLNPRAYNPANGLIVTANQDLNHLGQVKPMKLPMSSYRSDRIEALLKNIEKLSVDDMKRIHYDRYSLQADSFMEIIRPLLADTGNGEILKNWNMQYDAASLGATLFERIYQQLIEVVFGQKGIGATLVNYIINDTFLFALLHGNFDRILLSDTSVWFNGQSREEIFKSAIGLALKEPPIPHRQTRQVTIQNLFFGGKLPYFLGFDYKLELIGSRATIPQSQIFSAYGRPSSFAATFRMITDLATDELHTNIAGGASDRRFSKYYKAGLKEWAAGVYDILKP